VTERERQSHQVQYGTTTIEYELAYAPRRTLAISVEPDLRVAVVAPPGTDPEEVAARVRKRAPWIMRQRRELERYLPATTPRRYVSGETHRYLGRQHRLKVVEAAIEGVKLTRGHLVVALPNKANRGRVKALLDGWYHVQARRVFRERLQAMRPRFQQLIADEPRLAIKQLVARWGSCSGSGTITLNLRLMQVPKQYIDYVVVHELCHLVEHNHSKRYYQLLDRMLPDWRERRRRLNELQIG
jgi:predicted metal-dependent hydrolase